MSELVQSSVHLTKTQKEYVKNNYINLSRLTRASVDNLMKKREGLALRARPSQNPDGDLTNG